MEQTDANSNGAEPPFSLTRDDQGGAVMLLGETRLNLGPYQAAATVMADWLAQNDFGE